MTDRRQSIPDDDLRCIEAVELMTDYLEAALPEAERAGLESHMTHCEGCTEYLEQMRTVADSLGDLSRDTIPADMRAEVLAAFRGRRGR
jgi:anti-sigma factor RsiW